jgi:hypothetical protein
VPGDRVKVDAGGDVGGAGSVEDVGDNPMISVAVNTFCSRARRGVVDQQRVAAPDGSAERVDEPKRCGGDDGFFALIE